MSGVATRGLADTLILHVSCTERRAHGPQEARFRADLDAFPAGVSGRSTPAPTPSFTMLRARSKPPKTPRRGSVRSGPSSPRCVDIAKGTAGNRTDADVRRIHPTLDGASRPQAAHARPLPLTPRPPDPSDVRSDAPRGASPARPYATGTPTSDRTRPTLRAHAYGLLQDHPRRPRSRREDPREPVPHPRRRRDKASAEDPARLPRRARGHSRRDAGAIPGDGVARAGAAFGSARSPSCAAKTSTSPTA